MNPAGPSITSMVYDGTQLTVTWAGSATAVQAYLIFVLSPNGGPPFQAGPIAAPAASGSVPIAGGFGAGYTYQCTVAAIPAGGGNPVPGEAIAVVTGTTAFSSVDYDGARLALAWPPDQEPAAYGYRVDVTVGGSTTPHPTWSPSLVLPGTVAAGTSIVVRATASDNVVGAPSPAVTPLTASAAPSSVAYDGALLRVTLPAITGATGYAVSVLDGAATVGGLWTAATTATIPVALDSARTYAVSLRATNGVLIGPSASLGAVTSRPLIASVVLNATTQMLGVGWTMPSGVANVTGYSLWLASNGVPVAGPVAVSGAATLTAQIPSGTLDPPLAYEVFVQATGTSATGPASEPAAVIADQPQPSVATYDGGVVELAWAPVAAAGGYGVNVYRMDTNASVATFTTSATYGAVALTKLPQVQYAATICAIGTVATGPLSALTLYTDPVAIGTIAYDGEILTVTAASGNQGYRYSVIVDGSEVTRKHDTLVARIPVALPSASSCGVVLRSATPVPADPPVPVLLLLGPPTAGTVIAYVPAIATTVYDAAAATVTVTWTAVPNGTPGVTGFSAVLLRDGNPSGSPVAVSGSGATSAIFSNVVLDGWASYTATVAATGSSVTGPASEPVAVIPAAPALSSVAYDGTNATLGWTAVRGAAGYLVTVTPGVGNPQTYPTAGVTLPVPIASGTASVAVQAIAGGATGPSSASVAVVSETIVPATVLYDGAHVTATWSAATTANAVYTVILAAGSNVVASLTTTSTSAALAARLDPATAYTLAIRVGAGIASAPQGNGVAVISAVPAIASASVSTTAVTVTIPAATLPYGVVAYEASLAAGDTVVATATATIASGVATATISYSALPGLRYTAVARAIGATAATAAGPPSAPVPVIAAAPSGLNASYDGANVLASWNAVPDPSVTGYLVTITNTTTNAPVGTPQTTNATSITIAQTLALGTSYVVTVQAVAPQSAGPPSAGADPLAAAVGYFFPTAQQSSYAYVFRGDIRGPGKVDPVTLYLPNLFVSSNVTPQPLAPFAINAAPSPVNTSFPYVLSISGTGALDVWAFTGNGIRTPIQTAYVSFLQQLETVAGGLLPGALQRVQQTIAQGMPQSFAETLYYACGFDTNAGYVDMRPGMRLRIDFESYQLISGQALLSGYGGSGSSYYDVASLPTNGTSFPTVLDAFLAQMTIPAVASNAGGSGGIIDVQSTDFRRPFVRIFYPATMPSSDGAGSAALAQNVVVLWANTFGALTAATAQFVQARNFTGLSGIGYAYFRGRAELVPQLPCTVGGETTWVAAGTTVRNLLQRTGSLPFGQAVTIAGLAYRRLAGNAIDTPGEASPAFAVARTNTVNFGFAPANGYAYTGLDCFDLPVLLGDELTLGA